MQSLLFVLGLLVVGVIGYIVQDKSYRFGFAGVIALATSVVVLSIFVLAIPIVTMDENSNIRAYHAFVETIDSARLSDLSDIERASLTVKIAEWNEYVAKIQYQNGTVLDWWIPDAVMELEPIK